mmetsp:Transcript_50739/g.162428  ORF Transcript_50739/g.162428 Transcript_50739/m.162428 type:complete len:242 (+) Transcript_50739:720-1445(+)
MVAGGQDPAFLLRLSRHAPGGGVVGETPRGGGGGGGHAPALHRCRGPLPHRGKAEGAGGRGEPPQARELLPRHLQNWLPLPRRGAHRALPRVWRAGVHRRRAGGWARGCERDNDRGGVLHRDCAQVDVQLPGHGVPGGTAPRAGRPEHPHRLLLRGGGLRERVRVHGPAGLHDVDFIHPGGRVRGQGVRGVDQGSRLLLGARTGRGGGSGEEVGHKGGPGRPRVLRKHADHAGAGSGGRRS